LLLGLAVPALAAGGGSGGGTPKWIRELVPIAFLLAAVVLVLSRLPRIDVGHTDAFRRRRVWNWLPLGLTYSFLYFGRYNLETIKNVSILDVHQYGTVFGVGAAVYGISFLINGPLADRWGGRRTILIAAFGSGMMNALMGALIFLRPDGDLTLLFCVLYGANMYFQSFGAVSIVKVNAAWFHLRERGVFGGIFGILISLGIYFAFDWSHRIAAALPYEWVFLVPAILLAIFWVIDHQVVRDNPSDCGLVDFDPADASSGEQGGRMPVLAVFGRMLRNPVIVTIALIEFCSGFLRNAIMHWYRSFASSVGMAQEFVYQNWGMLLCVAGITGGMFAGVISDRVFGSRRGPVAAVLYGIMLAGGTAVVFLFQTPSLIGWAVVFMSMAIIGVHGMLSGTASQDFGGKNNAGVAVGIIDGFVYAGTAFQSFLYGSLLPEKGSLEGADPANWTVWPIAMVPVALIGLLLAIRVWHARPGPASKATR
jgi:OPA family glycerol-3-phosphate transporter-like MFS transporter